MSINYNKQANEWLRDQPSIPTDFVGRPEVYNIIKKAGRDKTILDLGCGEGYMCRKMARLAKKVIGIDKSREMIRLAKRQTVFNKNKIDYFVSDVKNLYFIPRSSIDICLAIHVIQYIKPRDLNIFYRQIKRILKKGGLFVVLFPHPFFVLLNDYGQVWHYNKTRNFNYVLSRGKFFQGKLKNIQGKILKIGIYHTTLTDQLNAVLKNNLKLTQVKELVFPKRQSGKHGFFGELSNKVISVLLVGQK